MVNSGNGQAQKRLSIIDEGADLVHPARALLYTHGGLSLFLQSYEMGDYSKPGRRFATGLEWYSIREPAKGLLAVWMQ